MSLPLSSCLQFENSVDHFGYDNCSLTEVASNKLLSSLSPLRKMDFALCKYTIPLLHVISTPYQNSLLTELFLLELCEFYSSFFFLWTVQYNFVAISEPNTEISLVGESIKGLPNSTTKTPGFSSQI